ncbi:MAG TPA: T9SS type A sorting domain-containing protein, partial [Arachidicoccus sp.]|nr:T9SS type A sorting domain-containing protein [Arachidicoccus sp.]
IGNLTYMEPGKGYMLYRKDAADATLVYGNLGGGLGAQSNSSTSPVGKIARSVFSQNTAEMTAAVPGNFKYSENMTLVAEVDNAQQVLPGDAVLAYIDGELRGRAVIMKNPLTNKDAFLFNISGNGTAPVSFAIERKGRQVAATAPVFRYASNARLGTLSSPYLIEFNATDAAASLYPNPFNDKVNIKLSMPASPTGTHEVQLSVYDISGKLIVKRPSARINGTVYQTVWDGTNAAGKKCVSGVYIIKILIDRSLQSFKVMKQ